MGWWEGSPESLQGNQKETMDRRKGRVWERPDQINPSEVLSRNEQGVRSFSRTSGPSIQEQPLVCSFLEASIIAMTQDTDVLLCTYILGQPEGSWIPWSREELIPLFSSWPKAASGQWENLESMEGWQTVCLLTNKLETTFCWEYKFDTPKFLYVIVIEQCLICIREISR